MSQSVMTAKSFRAALPTALRERLPEGLQGFEHRARFSLVQFWYAEPAFHYEVWPQRKQGRVEIGLHFEHRDAARNAALHRFFDQHLIEIWHELGEIWLEKWDRGWHKLYVTRPFERYDQPALEQVAAELSRQIVVLEPFLAEARDEVG